ncbi:MULTISPECIES: DUF4139 domain-containing protein [unclassified Psychrobacter]|uniref:DUF4139 domain-containing protein n=1 Tax=unclassified Psychrobacter TaxID=196806 RepID=UPI0025E1C638|nr:MULTISPECIES: DUF4139 domain-containing protein [unclassified Psychrobacter]
MQLSLSPLPLLGIVASGLTLWIPINAQAANSSIEQITIYQGLASVTRTLPINGSGEQTLIFSCLSPSIETDSISVQALGNVNVGEVSIQTLSGEQAAQCQYQGAANVQNQQSNLANISAELEAARLTKAYLQNLTKVTQINTTGTLANNAHDLETQAASINKKIIELQKREARAKDDLNQLVAGSTSSVQNNVTQVSVRTASRTPSTVKLHYQVRGASWEPTYQARLNTDSQQLNITASAIIAQQTGENWNNVPVVLSTVNPNQTTTSQLPRVEHLSLYEAQQAKLARYAQPMMEMEATPVVMVSANDNYGGAEHMPPLPSFIVSSQNKNGVTEYRLPQRVTIPSDGRRIQTVIDEQSGISKLWLRSTPSVEAAAYWYASAPFLTPAWADGSLQLYRDDNYVGQSRYSYQNLKEQGIGFGVDPSLLVKQLTDENKQGDKGVFNRQQTKTITQAYQFTNQHNRSVRLQVLSAEPVSRDDNIKVTATHTPAISIKDWNNDKGIVAWEFDLPSKQAQVLQSTYQISYPADKKLNTN